MKIVILIIKKIILIVMFVFLMGAGMLWLFIEYGVTYFQCKEITIGKNSVYLKYKVSGNDTGTISISTSKSRWINSSSDYVYENSECLFYQIQNDTIHIFSRKIANQPPKFKSKIHFIQKSVSNSEFMNLYENYKTLEYEKFPLR